MLLNILPRKETVSQHFVWTTKYNQTTGENEEKEEVVGLKWPYQNSYHEEMMRPESH